MASVRLVLNPEQSGIGEPFVTQHLDGTLIHLKDDDEIVISGLEHGMQSGAPSMMFGFVLPDGRAVLAETSWKLFAAAFQAFAGKFGTHDVSGVELHYDATGGGDKVKLLLQADDAPQFFECELCGKRIDRPPGLEGAREIAQWVHRHFREDHPGHSAPDVEVPE